MGERYTLLFKTRFLETGYNAVISHKSAMVTGEAWIVDTAHPEHVLCKLLVGACHGGIDGDEFQNGKRIRMAYAREQCLAVF